MLDKPLVRFAFLYFQLVGVDMERNAAHEVGMSGLRSGSEKSHPCFFSGLFIDLARVDFPELLKGFE